MRDGSTYRSARRAAMRKANGGALGPRTLRQGTHPTSLYRPRVSLGNVPPYNSARAIARYSRQFATGQKKAPANGVVLSA